MMGGSNNLFIVWNPFQRRSESLASIFSLKTQYIHFHWEERSQLLKAISYLPKFYLTIRALIKHKPSYVFIQLAPTPLLYTVGLYNFLVGTPYIADCHNTMIYDDHWIKWPLAKILLRRAYITLVHNDDVSKLADQLKIPSLILRDPLPIMSVNHDIDSVAGIDIKTKKYIIIPCGMAADEPVNELFDVARALPEILFVMTWFKEGLPINLRAEAPDNIYFTGFLEEADFNALYANANGALVLTTREGTQPSGAAEAIALGVPLIVSKIATTKRLYRDAPVFVENNPESIVAGVRFALNNGSNLSNSIASLRDELVNDAGSQIEAVKRKLEEIE